jgi:hypothetical protein
VEDRAAGDAELLAARLALEERAGPVLVDRKAAAGRADRIAARAVEGRAEARGCRLCRVGSPVDGDGAAGE